MVAASFRMAMPSSHIVLFALLRESQLVDQNSFPQPSPPSPWSLTFFKSTRSTGRTFISVITNHRGAVISHTLPKADITNQCQHFNTQPAVFSDSLAANHLGPTGSLCRTQGHQSRHVYFKPPPDSGGTAALMLQITASTNHVLTVLQFTKSFHILTLRGSLEFSNTPSESC